MNFSKKWKKSGLLPFQVSKIFVCGAENGRNLLLAHPRFKEFSPAALQRIKKMNTNFLSTPVPEN